MSSASAHLLLIFSLSLSLSLSLISVAANDPPSVYEVIQSYNFPAGLLPQGVTSYELDRTTGKFSVYLGGSCSFSISGYDLKYESTISGKITYGKISDLNGIQVKILFFWINIIEVSIDGNELAFSVGIASANFPIDNFNECPQCGCGFDCVKRSDKFGFVRRFLPLLQFN